MWKQALAILVVGGGTLAVAGCADPVRAPTDASAKAGLSSSAAAVADEQHSKDSALDASAGSGPDAMGGFKPIQCSEPLFRTGKLLYFKLKSSSRPLALMNKGDEVVMELTGASRSSVSLDELVLRYEPNSNLEVLGPRTATFRGVPYATQDSDLITPKIRVRLKGDGGELRIFYAATQADEETSKAKRALAAEAKTLAITIGFGNLAEDAPRLNSGSLADLVARALEPCVKESMHCFGTFLGLNLKVVITFANSGAVKHAEVDGVSDLISTCMKDRIARLSVPPFDGEPFEVQIPLIMSDQPHALLRVE